MSDLDEQALREVYMACTKGGEPQVVIREEMNFEPIPGVSVIGLGHKARHGKDTAGAAILSAIAGSEKLSFAADLYAVARVFYGMTTKDAPLLQQIGADFRGVLDEDVWVRSVYAKMLDTRPRLAVITDVRYRNEFDFVKQLGGTTVDVMRFNRDGSDYVDPSRPADHLSEVGLDGAPWDFYITALDGDVQSIRSAAVLIADTVLAEHRRKQAA